MTGGNGTWTAHKLDELGYVRRGRSRHRPRNEPSLYGGQYPFFQTGDIKAAEFWLHEYTQTYNEKGLAQSKLWEPQTLCITIAANIAETAVLQIPGCFPDSVVGFVADRKKADVRFIKYCIDTLKMRMVSVADGTAQDNLSVDKLLRFDFVVPSVEQQRRISAILGAYDDLIENNRRRIQILEEMARLIYREWFVKFRFPGHEDVKLVESPLGKIPDGWTPTPVVEAIDFKPRVDVPREGDKPYVAMAGLSKTSMLIEVTEYRTRVSGARFQNFDTLMARITPCLEHGKTGFVQFLVDDNATAIGSTEFIVMRSRTLCPEYVYLLAREEDFRGNAIKSMSGASGRQRVNSGCFNDYLIAHPDSGTLASFTKTVQPLFRSIHLLANKQTVLQETRDVLLPRLISGEVDVSELDIEVPEEAA